MLRTTLTLSLVLASSAALAQEAPAPPAVSADNPWGAAPSSPSPWTAAPPAPGVTTAPAPVPPPPTPDADVATVSTEGLVPVVIESSGASQEVRLSHAGDALCRTPCTLRLPPGRYTLTTGGRGLRTTDTPVFAQGSGARIVVRAASRGRFVGGVVLTSAGTLTLASMGLMSAVAFMSAPGDGYNNLMGGIMAGVGLAVGVPLLATGVALLRGARTGIDRVEGDAVVAPRVNVGLAPMAGGAYGSVHVTF